MHFPTKKKATFSYKNLVFGGAQGKKLQEIAGGFQGSRIKNATQLSQGPCGTIVPATNLHPSQGQTGQTILLWNSTENSRFVPGTGPGLSQGRVPVCPRDGSRFVPGTGPVCPRDGSCLSRTLSRPKCLCLLAFYFHKTLSKGFAQHHLSLRSSGFRFKSCL